MTATDQRAAAWHQAMRWNQRHAKLGFEVLVTPKGHPPHRVTIPGRAFVAGATACVQDHTGARHALSKLCEL